MTAQPTSARFRCTCVPCSSYRMPDRRGGVGLQWNFLVYCLWVKVAIQIALRSIVDVVNLLCFFVTLKLVYSVLAGTADLAAPKKETYYITVCESHEGHRSAAGKWHPSYLHAIYHTYHTYHAYCCALQQCLCFMSTGMSTFPISCCVPFVGAGVDSSGRSRLLTLLIKSNRGHANSPRCKTVSSINPY